MYPPEQCSLLNGAEKGTHDQNTTKRKELLSLEGVHTVLAKK